MWSRMAVASLFLGDDALFLEHVEPASRKSQMARQLVGKMLSDDSAEIGLSITEIVLIGNMIRDAEMKETSVRNWLKRDAKALVGAPVHGRKYAIDQAVLLLMIEDMHGVLDLATVCQILENVFNQLDDRNDDLLSPKLFYQRYAQTFLQAADIQKETNLLDKEYNSAIYQAVQRTCYTLPEDVRKTSEQTLEVMVHAALANHFQYTARSLAERLEF
ncbi:DUF1836 domain-containing protein [Litoribacterium kuwaitense]|uniref:DUF1836 domain-containing protein n=1 Tax=Litoribacterium kuwaitense TaxID=1398745 RepID=UPI0028ACC197|nr:DUF1836 domain-containing protein [Litoribacterium kuwaitense]